MKYLFDFQSHEVLTVLHAIKDRQDYLLTQEQTLDMLIEMDCLRSFVVKLRPVAEQAQREGRQEIRVAWNKL